MKRFIAAFLIAIFCSVAVVSTASAKAETPKSNKFVFKGDTIPGWLPSPEDLGDITAWNNRNLKTLIEYRVDFNDRVLDSVNDI